MASEGGDVSSESRVGRLTRRDFLKMGGGALAGAYAMGGLAGCGGGGSVGGPTELTLWAWLPDMQTQVDMFEEAHKNIKVKLVNAGQGDTEYEKLRTALKAGSGAPDVVHMEFQFIPSFRQIDGLADISEFGANDLKNDYAAWTWEQVSEGDAVYAMPWDSGPMALLYRKDVFDQYGLEVPATWDQFAQEAEKLHKADSETYLADFTPTDGGWITGLIWQAGARPFQVDGAKVSINMDDPAIQKVSEYWGDLVDRRVGSRVPRRYRWKIQGQVARGAAPAVGGRCQRLVQLGRLYTRRNNAERERRGGGPARHVAHPRPRANQALHHQAIPVSCAQRSAQQPGIQKPEVRLLRRTGGQRRLRRGLQQREQRLRVEPVPGLRLHPDGGAVRGCGERGHRVLPGPRDSPGEGHHLRQPQGLQGS